MPEISRFSGIIIAMYYNDHPPPHFHARLGDFEIRVNILNGDIISGYLPKPAESMVREWWQLHRQELLTDWRLARERAQLRKIAPLE